MFQNIMLLKTTKITVVGNVAVFPIFKDVPFKPFKTSMFYDLNLIQRCKVYKGIKYY